MSTAVGTVVSEKLISQLLDEGILLGQGYKYVIPDATSKYMLIRTGDMYPHVFLSAIANGNITLELFILPTITNANAEEPTKTFNLNSSYVSTVKWYPEPTIADNGTHLSYRWVLGGTGANPAQSVTNVDSSGVLEVILTPNTDFLIGFHNTADRDVELVFDSTYWERAHDCTE